MITIASSRELHSYFADHTLQNWSGTMLPETGRKLPNQFAQLDGSELVELLGMALRSELGGSRRATKTVMSWTGVCDRAARHWINGSGGVSGVHLIQLARQSDEVWRMVLGLSSRDEAAVGFDIHAAEVALSRALGSIEALKRQAIASRNRAQNMS